MAENQTPKATDVQVGGDHYKKLKIQPVEYIHANGLGFCEGSVIKYVTRWRDKNGLKDLEKARHFLDLLIQLETEAAGMAFPVLDTDKLTLTLEPASPPPAPAMPWTWDLGGESSGLTD